MKGSGARWRKRDYIYFGKESAKWTWWSMLPFRLVHGNRNVFFIGIDEGRDEAFADFKDGH
jgi:hypothetical protein